MLRLVLAFILAATILVPKALPNSNSPAEPTSFEPTPANWVVREEQCTRTKHERSAAHPDHDVATCGPSGSEHLSEEPLQGLHVLKLPHASSGCASAGSGELEVEVYVDGVSSSAPPRVKVPVTCNVSLQQILPDLREIVDVERPVLHQRLGREKRLTSLAAKELREGAATRPPTDQWRGFSPTGKNLWQHHSVMDTLQRCRAVYVYEGGVFIWPGIHPGYQRELPVDASGRDQHSVVMTTLSLQPLVFSIAHLLSGAQCDWLIEVGKRHMRLQPKGLMAPRSLAVTSVSAQTAMDTLAEKTQPTLLTDVRAAAIEKLVANITRMPVSHGEPLHVLEYPAGHRYDAHLDSFEHASNYRKKAKILQQLDGGRNRLSTLLAYLHEPEKGGGETLFPRAGGAAFPKSYVCTPDARGLRVTPQRGAALLWYNLRADGEQDRLTLHSGCAPAAGGSKWVSNMWTWNKPYN